MPWTIPDKGTADNDLQTIAFSADLDILQAGLSGTDCVLSGGAVTGNANLVPSVAKCAVMTNGVMKAVAAATVTITTADATNPRIDLIVVNSSGTLAVRAGTAAANPKPPARTANDVVLAFAYVPAAATSLGTTKFIDKRVTPSFPLVIYRTTTAETTNTTAAAIHLLNKTSSGVTIPNGLLQAGRILRVKIASHLLINSGTPTITLIITFNGVTWYSSVTAVSTAGAPEHAFNMDFDLVSQSTTVQALNGQINLNNNATAAVAPTTGIAGTIAGTTQATANIIVPFSGAAGTVNTDSADNVLACTLTYNVSNAADQVVTTEAIVELL